MLTDSFPGRCRWRTGPQRRHRAFAGVKAETRARFRCHQWRERGRGRGITPKITIDLLRAGVSVITTGDHIWDQKEIIPFIDTEPRLLRPINYPAGTPGAGRSCSKRRRAKSA